MLTTCAAVAAHAKTSARDTPGRNEERVVIAILLVPHGPAAAAGLPDLWGTARSRAVDDATAQPGGPRAPLTTAALLSPTLGERSQLRPSVPPTRPEVLSPT